MQLSDLIGFVVALVALLVTGIPSSIYRIGWADEYTLEQIQERETPAPKEFTFGYQRATLLGAFFNGVFLLALSVSILVQAIERFVNLDRKPLPPMGSS